MDATKRTIISLRIFLVAIALGVFGDSFLNTRPWGAGVTAFAAIVFAAVLYLRTQAGTSIAKSTVWVAIASLCFAALFSWRDADGLRALNGLVLFLCIGFVALRAGIGAVYATSLADLMWRAPLQWFGFLGQAGNLVSEDIQWKQLTERRRYGNVLAVGRGLLLAVVPVGLIVVLLANADAVFEKVVTPNISIDPDQAFINFAVWALIAFLSAGFIRKLLHVNQERISPPVIANSPKPATKLGITEVGTVLVALNAVIGLFVVIQFRYLFGGSGHVQATTGLSYAEYARRGFFELLTVVALAIPILIALESLVKGYSLRNQKIFRCTAGIFVLQILIVAASALQRMKLYVDYYSLSPLRLYAVAGMIFMIGLLGLFLGTTLRGRSNRFAFGALIWLSVVVIGLNVANPDATIASYNLQPRPGYSVDGQLLASLSTDATPALLVNSKGLDAATRHVILNALDERFSEFRPWQSQTLSYRIAFDQWKAAKKQRINP